MARSWSPVVTVVTLTVGVALGVFVGRARPTVVVGAPAAQVGEDGRETKPNPPTKPSGDDAVYDELTRQYQGFQSVDRTFALVAKAVSPSVVHIVAKKTGEPDDDGQPKVYEETSTLR